MWFARATKGNSEEISEVAQDVLNLLTNVSSKPKLPGSLFLAIAGSFIKPYKSATRTWTWAELELEYGLSRIEVSDADMDMG